MLVAICEAAKEFPRYVKACEETLLGITEGEEQLEIRQAKEDLTRRVQLEGPDIEMYEEAPLHELNNDDRCEHLWRRRLRLQAIAAKRMHDLAFAFLVHLKWRPKIKAWKMRAAERAYAPGGSAEKRLKTGFYDVASNHASMP